MHKTTIRNKISEEWTLLCHQSLKSRHAHTLSHVFKEKAKSQINLKYQTNKQTKTLRKKLLKLYLGIAYIIINEVIFDECQKHNIKEHYLLKFS